MSAVGDVVLKYGLEKLVEALGGSKDLQGLTSDIFDALPSQDAMKVDPIEALVALQFDARTRSSLIPLRTGVQYLELSAHLENVERKVTLLEKALGEFSKAIGAAVDLPLHAAMAQRWIVLVLLELGETAAARKAIVRTESACIATLFEAHDVLDSGDAAQSDALENALAWQALSAAAAILNQVAALSPGLGLPAIPHVDVDDQAWIIDVAGPSSVLAFLKIAVDVRERQVVVEFVDPPQSEVSVWRRAKTGRLEKVIVSTARTSVGPLELGMSGAHLIVGIGTKAGARPLIRFESSRLEWGRSGVQWEQ